MVTLLLSSAALAQTVEVAVHGVHGAGKVGCTLFVAADGFPADNLKAHSAIQVEASKADKGVLTCRFEGVAAEQVAIAVRHDRNSNGKLDKNWLGVPVEPYGFSRDDGRVMVGPPRFEDAVVPSKSRIRIDLRGSDDTVSHGRLDR